MSPLRKWQGYVPLEGEGAGGDRSEEERRILMIRKEEDHKKKIKEEIEGMLKDRKIFTDEGAREFIASLKEYLRSQSTGKPDHKKLSEAIFGFELLVGRQPVGFAVRYQLVGEENSDGERSLDRNLSNYSIRPSGENVRKGLELMMEENNNNL